MAANDRGYGHGRVAGLSTCRQAEQLARAQSYQIPRQPACEHRRVLWPSSFMSFSRLNVSRYNVKTFANQIFSRLLIRSFQPKRTKAVEFLIFLILRFFVYTKLSQINELILNFLV